MDLKSLFNFSNLRTKVAIGFSLISAISLGISWTDYHLIKELVESKNWESHTYEVLERLEAVVSDLKDVETGQRGYMLNGQKTFLEPYYAGLKAIPQDIRALRHLTKENPIQQQRIDMLESLALKKIAIAKMRVETRRSQGLEASIRVGTFGSGHQTMQSIRWLVQVMKETEAQLLRQRSQQAETAVQKAAYLSFIGLGSDLAILLGLYYLINSEITQRQRITDSLYESERRFHALFDQTFQFVGLLTTEGILLEANQTALEAFGIKRSEVIGRPFWETAWWTHSPELQTRLKAAITEVAGGQFVRFESQHPGTRGAPITVDFSLKPVMNETGQVVLLIPEGRDISERKRVEVELQQARDQLENQVTERTAKLQAANLTLKTEITERKQAEKEVRLLQDIGQAVSESSDFHAALRVALRKVCETTSWNYGEAWIPCSDDIVLEHGLVYYGSKNTLEQFRQVSERFTFSPGVGLPGRVWLSRQPEWIQDVSVQPESVFLRVEAAMATGLGAALGIPVIANGRVLAVLVFFMSKSYKEDERLVNIISAIATQLGTIMQRKQAEESLEASERQLRMVTDHTPVLIAYCDTEGRYRFVNKGYAERFGLTREEVIGKRIPEVVGEEGYSNFRQQVEAVLSGQTVEFEVEIPYQRIGWRYMHVAYVPEFGPQGEVRGLIAAISDITQRRRAEVALRKSEERYRALVTTSVQIIWTNNAEGKMTGEQPGWASLTGQTYEQYQNYGWSAALHPEDREYTLQRWCEAVERKGLFEVEHRVRRHDGKYRHFAVRAAPVVESDGSIREWIGSHTDITERKQAEAALMESEERYRILTEVSPQMVWVTRPDGSNIYSNQWWFNYTGLTMEQTANDGWASVVHPEDSERVLKSWKHAVARDKDYELEIRFRKASDGTYRWHLARGLPLRDARGQTVKWLGIAVDIHHQKELETQLRIFQGELEARIQARTQELADLSQRLQGILDNIGDAVIVVNKQGNFLLFNPAARRILGTGSTTQAPDQWSKEYGLYLPDRVTPYPIEELPLTLALQGDVADEVEVFVRSEARPTGIWLSAGARPLKDANGEVIGGIAVFHDVTERKRAEVKLQDYATKLEQANRNLSAINVTLQTEITERQRAEAALQGEQEFLKALLDSLEVGVVACDAEGILTLSNRRTQELHGLPLQPLPADQWAQYYDLYLPDNQTPMKQEEIPLFRALRGELVRNVEVMICPKWGLSSIVSVSGAAITTPDGGKCGAVVAIHDVTQLKAAEAKLRTYAAKLEKANQELKQFNYIAAHDLRTPLRTITTRMDLLNKQLGPLSANAQHQLSRISLAALRMDRLLTDLVFYSQVGNRVNSLTLTNTQVILEQVLKQLKQLIQQSGATIEVESPLPTVLADPFHLTYVWQHLISNSLKFYRMTPQITISATCSSEECTFCVADNGIGIPRESQQQIFGVFKRLNSQERYEGTGIGLAIVKRILDWHGGQIWLKSEVGRGSKFFFTLRRADTT